MIQTLSIRTRLCATTLALALPLAASAHGQTQEGDADRSFANADAALEALEEVLSCSADRATFTAINDALTDLYYKETPEAAFKDWKYTPQDDNAFIALYELPRGVQVAGHATRTIVSASGGLLGLLDDADARQLSAQLKLQRSELADHVYVREVERVEEGEGVFAMSFIKRLTVSTLSTHAGRTLAGCEYAVEQGGG
ncbi:MAG TPA: hypothetical protein VGD42_13050 [Lysobacter sp.]